MKKPELLSPVGNKECLIAAINAGCDAVYLGGKNFGARNYAGNFNDEELVEAIKYAHVYGVKVYVTVNTMIYEAEVDSFMKYIDFLHKNNVDALIIQDLGMMDLIRKTYPNLELHASTQMNIHNLEGVKLLENLGIKRVVLAREVNIEKIKEIKEKTNIELEIFIHGALCVSYSGECLMSSLINGRSGNRGTCSQCCRMKYDLISAGKKINKDEYLLSTKDLNTLEHLDELLKINVDSLKIEGRMKRPEYVYLITKIYRRAIDNYFENKKIFDKQDILEMQKIFNREFTKGFLFNEENNNFVNQYRPNHIGIKIGEVISKNKIKLSQNINQGDGIRIIGNDDIGFVLNKIYKNGLLVSKAFKNDIIEIDKKYNIKSGTVLKTTDKEQLEQIDSKIKINKKIKIDIIASVDNDNFILQLSDGVNNVEVKDNIVERAINNGTSIDRIKVQLSKLNDTPFKVDNIDIDIKDNIFIRIKDLNDLRRKAVSKLIEKRCYKIEYKKEDYHINLPDYDVKNNYSYLIETKEDYEKIKDQEIENIYIEEPLYSEINDARKVKRINRINFDLNGEKDKLLIGDLGSLYKYKNVITDFNFNVTNSYTVAFLHSLNVDKVTLSYELKYSQIKNIVDAYHKRYNKHPNLELIISAYPEAMISKFDLLKYYNIKEGYLKDNFNNKYKLKSKNDLMTIYHYEKIELKEDYFDIGINSLRIHL